MKKSISMLVASLLLSSSILPNFINKWEHKNLAVNNDNFEIKPITLSLSLPHQNSAVSFNSSYLNSINQTISKFTSSGHFQPVTTNTQNKNKETLKTTRNLRIQESPLIILKIIGGNSRKHLQLVLNKTNLYLEGFISGTAEGTIDPHDTDRVFYHFNDSSITRANFPFAALRIKATNLRTLNYSSHYQQLIGSKALNISASSLSAAIHSLQTITLASMNQDVVKNSLVQIIFATSESLRFFTIRNMVNDIIKNPKKTINWQSAQVKNIINDWGKMSQDYWTGKITNAENNISILRRQN